MGLVEVMERGYTFSNWSIFILVRWCLLRALLWAREVASTSTHMAQMRSSSSSIYPKLMDLLPMFISSVFLSVSIKFCAFLALSLSSWYLCSNYFMRTLAAVTDS